MSIWLWVGLGGAIGACGRFAVAQLVPAVLFPWPTLAVNLIGGCAIGALVGMHADAVWYSDWGRAFLVTGVLGGFTTFSAFSLEVVQLAQGGHAVLALTYAMISVLCCALGAWLGLSLAGGSL